MNRKKLKENFSIGLSINNIHFIGVFVLHIILILLTSCIWGWLFYQDTNTYTKHASLHKVNYFMIIIYISSFVIESICLLFIILWKEKILFSKIFIHSLKVTFIFLFVFSITCVLSFCSLFFLEGIHLANAVVNNLWYTIILLSFSFAFGIITLFITLFVKAYFGEILRDLREINFIPKTKKSLKKELKKHDKLQLKKMDKHELLKAKEETKPKNKKSVNQKTKWANKNAKWANKNAKWANKNAKPVTKKGGK